MQLEQLKEKFKVAVNQFYLNKYMDQPTITDSEFEKLLEEAGINGIKVKDVLEIEESDYVSREVVDTPLQKIIVEDNIKEVIRKYIEDNDIKDYYINRKNDGGSIEAIYQNGILKKILSTPFSDTGLDKTASFFDLFPTVLKDKTIVSLRGEVLVDTRKYGQKARNKANGLLNSKHKSEEVNSECFIRVYKVRCEGDTEFDYQRNLDRLKSLPTLYMTRLGDEGEVKKDYIFSVDTKINLELLVDDPLASYVNMDIKGEIKEEYFQNDGYVLYSEKGIVGFKYMYTEMVETEVKNILWNEQPNGSYSAVVEIDPVILNEKKISKINTNGVSRMIELRCGVGSKIVVSLKNMVIPQIISVITPSDNFEYPKCDCGYQMSQDDIYGLTLKCGEIHKVCSSRYNKWIKEFSRWLLEDTEFKDCSSFGEAMNKAPQFMGYAFYVDRWDPFDKCKLNDISQVYTIIKSLYISEGRNGVYKFMTEKLWKFSPLQLENFNVNFRTGIAVIEELMGKTFEEIKYKHIDTE